MVIENADGSLTFRVYYPHAEVMEIRGTFVPPGQEGIPMARGEHGWWSAKLAVPSGEHTFRYVANGHASLPDYAAGGIQRDPGGGAWLSCLHVPERDEQEATAGMAAAVEMKPAESGQRTATLTINELDLLRAGGRVRVEVQGDGRGPLMLALEGMTTVRGPERAIPRPDRPVERRREPSRREREAELPSRVP